jgi:hypothetical protein
MNDKPLLSDETVHDRLVAAAEALGTGQAETTRGQTALYAAKRALVILQWGLVQAMENDEDHVQGVLPDAVPDT